jgi:hypothetical protein
VTGGEVGWDKVSTGPERGASGKMSGTMARRSKMELVAGAETPTCSEPLEIQIRELLSVGNADGEAT